jgi:hypothetical protein
MVIRSWGSALQNEFWKWTLEDMLVLASGISVQLLKEREVNGCE